MRGFSAFKDEGILGNLFNEKLAGILEKGFDNLDDNSIWSRVAEAIGANPSDVDAVKGALLNMYSTASEQASGLLNEAKGTLNEQE
jgi:hypothetical protein